MLANRAWMLRGKMQETDQKLQASASRHHAGKGHTEEEICCSLLQ